MQVQSRNPATGAVIDSYEFDTDPEAALTRAQRAFDSWRERPLRERERLLAALGETLRENEAAYAQVMTAEMGKPIEQARGEVEKCAWLCDHYAEYAGRYLQADRYPSPPGTDVRTRYDPLGPMLAVMPWNFPFWQVLRFAVPALAAGNVALLSHAPEVPGCAEAIADAFAEAGFPDGTFQNLFVDVETLHEAVVADDRVHALTLTGGEGAGRAVAETAGANLTKTVLELGGSDPLVVLPDADVEAAADTAVDARMQNGGQSCIAAKRILVHEAVAETFTDRFLDGIDDLVVGDPTDPQTDVGPLVSADHRDGLHEQVQASVDAGATLERGGEIPDREGAFYEPTVLTDVPAGCPAAEEEVFGPVASVFTVESAEAAITRANDTPYGLGASLWTDPDRGAELAADIDAGCVFVNEMTKSDPRVPFGGVKDSGYGRELGAAGVHELVNRKTVWVED
jgi:succinate-semialdehyde dehydrogenase/glutarate-semialdehyde dehydrogenase